MLEAVGLNETDERVYLAVLSGTPDAGLAARIGASPERVRNSLRRLVSLRLVREPALGGDHEVVPPEMALPTLIAGRAEAVRQTRRAADDLLAVFGQGTANTDPERVAERVPAAEAARRLTEMLDYAATDVLLAESEPPELPLDPACRAALAGLTARGVTLRVISTRSAWLSGPALAAAIDGQYRVVPALPARFAVVDGRHAAVALTHDPHAAGAMAILYGPTLLSTLAAVGQALWQQGRLVSVADARTADTRTADTRTDDTQTDDTQTDGNRADGNRADDAQQSTLSAEHRDLLRMLASGMKDEAIARHLGIGARTANRRIGELFELLGAETRFQAGLQAYRQGLL